MTFDKIMLALIFRGVVIPIFISMVLMFWKKYKKSSNKYFYGYFVFFIAILVVQIAVFIVDLYTYLGQEIQFDLLSTNPFADWSDEHELSLGFVQNFVKPSYILIVIILCIALASQITPLEIFLNDKRHIMSRLLIVSLIGISLIYIPLDFFRYSLYTQIVLVFAVFSMLIGFFVNIIVNLKLAITTIGEVRKRSIMVLLGFTFYILGLIWGARVGWSELIYVNWGYEEDVIFGNALLILSAILYYKGFKTIKM